MAQAKKSYEDNAYEWLKRKGLAGKYEHAGIYCIKIDGHIVYIGKSHNMLKRVAQHYVGIRKQSERKYRIMAEATRKGHQISFDVLYYASERSYSAITEEIGEKEGQYIRRYKPALNAQIPKENDWNQYTTNTTARTITLSSLLDMITEDIYNE